MKRLISFFARQHIAVNLAGAVIAAAGMAVFFLSPKEILPEIDFGVVQVATRFPGASPEEAEELITVHIEDAVKNLSGVDKVTSFSGEGISLVTIELSPAKKIQATVSDIKDAIDKTASVLPAEASKPEVKEISTREFPVITVAFSGADYTAVRQAAKNGSDAFKALPGVSSVEKLGFLGRTLWVNLKKDKLIHYELELLTIASSLRDANISVPVGAKDTSTSRIKMRVVSKTDVRDDVKQVIVKSGDMSHALTVADMAVVQEGFEDAGYAVDVNGKTGILLTVFKLSGKDSATIARQVRDQADLLVSQGLIGKDVAVSFSNDTSVQVRERISLLISNGGVGLFFILVILFLTLDRKLGFWITVGLPVTYGFAFLLMKAAGVGFDMLSLFGLIVVLGILDDDAIVVGENVYRHRAMGKDPFTAAVDGTAEVALPVFISFLTTVSAFMPLLLIGGVWGKFLAPIALAIIFSIAASIVECFLVMPSHLALASVPARQGAGFDIFKTFYAAYERALRFFLSHRGWSVVLSVAILIIGSALALRRGVLFAEGNIETIVVKLESGVTSSLSNTIAVARKATETIGAAAIPYIESIYGLYGVEQDEPGSEQTFTANTATLKINLTSSQNRPANTPVIVKSLYALLENQPGMETLSVKEKAGGGPGGRGDIDITFTGNSHGSVKQAASQAYALISRLKEVNSVSFKKTECRPEFDIAIDRSAAGKTGVSLQAVAATLRAAVSGMPLKTFRIDEEPVTLKVRLDPQDFNTPGDLLFLRVPGLGGASVRLSTLARFSSACGSEALTRYDGKPSYSLSGTIDKTQTSVGAVNLKLIPALNAIVKENEGTAYRLGGDYGEIKDRFAELGLLFLLSVFIMYTILASFFNSLTKPFIVLAAVPLSFTGVMLALSINGLPVSFPALIAVFALTGVSVNNAIVMIDFLNGLLLDGKSREESVVRSAMLRFKSVMISTFTVAFGILPLGYAVLGGQDAFLRPFAIALGWGIVFSGPAVIFAIPVAYVIHENMLSRIYNILHRDAPRPLLFSGPKARKKK